MMPLADGYLHRVEDLLDAGVAMDDLRGAQRDGRAIEILDGAWISMAGMLAVGNGLDYAAEVLLRPAVICLLSACQWHGVSNEDPSWICTSASSPPMPSIAWNEADMTVGVETMEIAGFEVRMTSAARTVVDMLRARGDLGDEPARAALMDWRERGTDEDLLDIARALGCEAQIADDLEHVPPLDMCWK